MYNYVDKLFQMKIFHVFFEITQLMLFPPKKISGQGYGV